MAREPLDGPENQAALETVEALMHLAKKKPQDAWPSWVLPVLIAAWLLTAQLSAPDANSRGFGFALSSGGGTEGAGPFLLVALGSGAALASVAAAPSGVPAAEILPAVLAELRGMTDSPSVAVEVVALAPRAEPPAGDSAPTPPPESAPGTTPETTPDHANP